MSLPFVLDVLISVVFIYLILSLLASEIQELITTLLQWRAKHLKDAIQSLISGGSSQDLRKVNVLMNSIYNDPLIKNINQEGHGLLATAFRSLTRIFFSGNRKGTFGAQSSGPSYIGADTFSTVMLDSMGVNYLSDKLVESRLEKFVRRITGDVVVVGDRIEANTKTDSTTTDPTITDSTTNAEGLTGGIWNRAVNLGIDLGGDDRFYHLIENFEAIQTDYRNHQSKISICIERISESLDYFIASYPLDGSDRLQTFIDRVKQDKLSLFGANNERAWITGGLEPSVSDIAALVDKGSNLHREIVGRYENLRSNGEELQSRVLSRKSAYLQQCSGLPESSMAGWQPTEAEEQTCLASALSELTPEEFQIYQDYQTHQRIDHILDHLPKSLIDSLSIIARRAQMRTNEVDSTIQNFHQEVSTWFDRTMDRTTGVYKRNAKGVAIIIGLIIAIFTNSDTFYIFNRVSSDDNLRKVITDRASQFKLQNPSTDGNGISQDLNALKNQTQEVLSDISLPITWSPQNLSQQLNCPYNTSNAVDQAPNTNDSTMGRASTPLTKDQWNALYHSCLPDRPNPSDAPIPFQVMEMITAKPFVFLRMFLGWLISGIAIAMGAPFWFDLLGKIINVRNAGAKPQS